MNKVRKASSGQANFYVPPLHHCTYVPNGTTYSHLIGLVHFGTFVLEHMAWARHMSEMINHFCLSYPFKTKH